MLHKKYKSGQALIMLISFIAIGLTIISSSIFVNMIQSNTTTEVQSGSSALNVAESGVENAMLRLLRNPNYTGETLSVDSGTSVTSVSGTGPWIIISTGEVGEFKRTLRVVVSDSGGTLVVTSWKEQ
mgnify:CR=1 FL=1